MTPWRPIKPPRVQLIYVGTNGESIGWQTIRHIPRTPSFVPSAFQHIRAFEAVQRCSAVEASCLQFVLPQAFCLASLLPGLPRVVIGDGDKLDVDRNLAGLIERRGTAGAEGVHFGVHVGDLVKISGTAQGSSQVLFGVVEGHFAPR